MPDWTNDELILAADLVSRNGWTGVRATSPAAIELSALLSKGQLHDGIPLPAGFRGPASIQRKTYDLATADEQYAGKPTRGGKLAGPMIRAFRTDVHRMQTRAAAIRAVLEAGEVLPAIDTEDMGFAVVEGGILEHIARKRERDPAIRARKIAARLKSGGPLSCEACGFHFESVYGQRGHGYIEVHHVLPLHVSGSVKTSLDDLALVCANCHRMCHRGPWITPAEVGALIASGV
jgi:5-methylcytosine-specific restriction protein A